MIRYLQMPWNKRGYVELREKLLMSVEWIFLRGGMGRKSSIDDIMQRGSLAGRRPLGGRDLGDRGFRWSRFRWS